ncbi:hypothetical protein HRR83_006485 [Exophiala dermatitidis]|nr:hypothetical protein HRR73_008760 [Exophiala dermatitidis]KAJ4505329.1 hypothetical protein HRR74_008700 [Exophiala dermatitidis]KAJ4563236.1 hypothetical protein HRR81_008563 [Exophiala dermatitidis]KAJ4593626.1 hypothetical protein HRR83_006485 [Exophiala dermatitidis]KAJ4600758.1 hypothetical protein HRR84_002640 [Exophiala dermatitidis]
MKTVVAAAAAAFVGAALAQSLSDLPACGQTCINNMLGLAESLGCPPVNGQPDTLCLCSSSNFGYGIRDCTVESCPQGTDVNSIVSFGVAYCQAAASGQSSVGTLSATSALTAAGTATGPAGSASGVTSLNPSATSAGASAGSATGTGGTSNTPVSTETLFSTFTTDGSTITSAVGTSTIFSAVGGAAVRILRTFLADTHR